MNNKFIYSPHYFDGEYDIPELLNNISGKKDFYGFHEISGSTIGLLLEAKLLKPKNYKAFILKEYKVDLSEDELNSSIIGIQFTEGSDTTALINALHDIAITLMDEASGDDDFFDYTPGTVEAIANFLDKLGHPVTARALLEELEKRGHND